MSLSHSPKIVTDGLVFAYDMANTQKSWKGAPTTNLLTNPDNFSLWSKTANSGTIASISTDITLSPDQSKLAEKLTLPNDGTYPRIYQYWTPASTALHTYSIWLKAASTPCTCQLYVFRNSPWNTSGTYTANITSEWTRFSYSFSPLDTTLHYVYIGSHDTAKGSIFYLSQAQIEVGSFAPPFVNGTRSNTQALVDLTGNNTVTASSLTYANDNTFSFNGSSNYLSFPSDTLFKSGGGWTVETNFKLDVVVAGSLYNFIGSVTNSYNSWYWTVYQSKLALWDKTLAIWKYGSTVIQANTWYRATIVCNDAGTGYQFYLNGVAEGGTHVGFAWTAAMSSLSIGHIGRSDAGSGRYFDGTLETTQVYNRALSASEVQQNFNATRGRYGL